jgi:hypothetical protein
MKDNKKRNKYITTANTDKSDSDDNFVRVCDLGIRAVSHPRVSWTRKKE